MFPTQQNLDDHKAAINYRHHISPNQFPFTTNESVESLSETESYYPTNDIFGQALLYKGNLTDDGSNKK